MKILNTIGENYTQEAKDILESLGHVDYVSWDQSSLLENIHEYDVAIIGLGLVFDAEVLDKATNLKVIGTATTGLDHIDLESAKRKSIDVLSLRGEDAFLSTITGTAEIAWGLLLSLVRKIPSSFDHVKAYGWDRSVFRGHELRDSTLGIVGYGRLGKMMDRYARAFEMRVVVHDPYVSEEDASSLDATLVSFDELLRESDAVSIHVHLSDETQGMFDASVFQKMKNTAVLINTSRGKIVDENHVLDALQNGVIAGYATDVLAEELSFDQNFSNHPLVEYAKEHDNLIIVPHIGGMTVQSRAKTDSFIAGKLQQNIQNYLS